MLRLLNLPRRSARAALLGVVLMPLLHHVSAFAQQQSTDPIAALSGPSTSTPLPNGVEVRAPDAIVQVTALSDTVLRVRIAHAQALPEDASWAVPPQARRAAITVHAQSDSGHAAFDTASVHVQIDLATLQLSVADLSGHMLQSDDPAWPIEVHGNSFRVYKSMPADEHYFGLGDKPGPLDRRGHSFTMWNTDAYAFQESTDEIYKTIPFFMAFRDGRATGILFDNTFRTSFDFGQTNPQLYSFGSVDGPIDYYILAGPEPKDVLRDYAWLTGLTPLPPMWALGYQQSRSSYFPQSRVEEVVRKLRTERIPADVLYLDIDYQKNLRPFTVDDQRFPHFAQMVADLKRDKFRVVAITDPHIADTPDGYAPYQSATAGDHLLRITDGSRYVGNVWPGDSVFPEFTRASSRAWWGTLYERFVHDDVAGFWNDMNEPAVFAPGKTMPDTVRHRIDEPGFTARTATHAEIHNVYGMENSRATFEGLLKLSPNKRPFVLTRATYAGGQRYAWTWTGDNASTWNHLRLTTPMLLNLGLSGFALSGADVGGFAGIPEPALLTKWFQLGAFQPLFREHSSRGSGNREPWMDGPAHEALRRKAIEQRYRLMPYLYTTAEEMSRTGIPIIRPLFVDFPHASPDGHPIDLDAGSEFLFGPDLLIAPAPFPEQRDSYEVKLPPGPWYDLRTGLPVQLTPSERTPKPGQTTAPPPALTVTPTLDVLPVYVRAGAILPIAPLTQSTMEKPNGPLTLRVYPGPDCGGSLYVDDGVSFAYRQGNFARLSFRCEATAHSIVVHLDRRQGPFPVWWSRIAVEVYGLHRAPSGTRVDSAPLAHNAVFDASTHMARIEVSDDGREQQIEILR